MQTPEFQPMRLTRRGECVKNFLIGAAVVGALLLGAAVEEVPESNPAFGISSTEKAADK